MRRSLTVTLAALVLGGAARVPAQQVTVDPRIAPYQKVGTLSGNASSIGSDTMNNLMALWLEGFRRYYPGVKIQIEGKGSSTAPPALIEGTAQFGPMSRPMKESEVDQFEKRFGYVPTEFRTSLDALAIFVNKDNPLTGLTLPQVDALFSKTRRGEYPDAITTWGQVGLTGEWASARISLYGRNSASGTYGFFKDHALFKGDYKDEVKEQPGSASVVQGVTEDRFAVGYSGIGYRTSGVRAVPLATRADEPYREGTLENVVSGRYPLSRFLLLYVNMAPNQPLDPMVREFCRFIFSREGQQIVIKDGYLPVPYEVAQAELAKLAD